MNRQLSLGESFGTPLSTREVYGTFDGYARISTRRKWILNTMAADPPNSLWEPLKILKNDKWPATMFGRRAAAFFKAFNSGQEAQMAKFYAEHRPPSPDGKTPQERVKGWQALLDQYGTYTVYGYTQATRDTHRYAVLVYSARAKIWRGVLFDLEENKARQVKTLRMWDASPPDARINRARTQSNNHPS